MTAWKTQLKKITSSRWWDSSLLVGLAIAIMIYTRFFGLSEPYIKAFDPYLFWRISENIWNTGVWGGIDPLRYYPFGWDSIELAPLVPHTLVYLGRLAGDLKAAVKFYPALVGILSILSMGLLGRRLKMSGLSALILAIIPAYMFRTSQGFADKEPLGFFLGLLGWYFVTTSLQERKLMPAILGGISMGAVATAWGGKVLFAFALVPLFGILFLREEYKRTALLSVSFIIYILMHFLVPRYAVIFTDYISMGLLGIAGFGILNYIVYKIPQLEQYEKKRMLISFGLGILFAGMVSLLTFGSFTTVTQYLVQTFQAPTQPVGTIVHGNTVAENQRPEWTWNLAGNQFYGQFGFFFFLSLGVLLIPILKKSWELVTKKGAVSQDYVYALALVGATTKLLIDFPKDAPVLLFLLGIPSLLQDKDLKTIIVNSIVAFSMYSAFSAIRLFTFTSVGIAIGAAYVLSILLKHKD
ncbi:MAG: hypothetical protein GOU98_03875, partial [Candidatus Altiarchaeota archaeon]|nr:hypothetical protein [Candidatus Altiarchaeota archaeon]